VAINLVLNAALIYPLGYVGLALSTSLAAWVNVAILLKYLAKNDWLRASEKLKMRIPRLTLASVIMGVILWQSSVILQHWLTAGILYNLLFLFTIIGEGLLAYCSIILVLKVFEFSEIKSVLKRV